MTRKTDFEIAAEGKASSLLWEFLQLLTYNKKWWLLPIVLLLLLFGLTVVLAGTGAAPFIYTLF